MEFIIKSKALYTTWVLYKPDRILFDVGEGISSSLGNKIYAIENIFLTHSHIDHISGLWGFINTRNNAMGSREKPLNIYYPENSEQIVKYISFIKNMNNRLRYSLNFIPINLKSVIEISETRYIKPFKTRHTPSELTFGYQIFEKRKRLKDEYKYLDQNSIIELSKKIGKDNISQRYDANILTISGDSLPIPLEYAENCEILLHECTFFKEEDRKIRNHTSLEELKILIKNINAKKIIIYHVSSRYNSIIKSTEEKLKKEFSDKEIYIVHPERKLKL
ncbi:MAG: ribonuclease [Oceanotoga sp.]|uniref:RNAse Z n=1 Tax=Oceanotoga teriensis TaxID=515440 RepID=A0AA45HJP7_9BACT|nr:MULTISPECIES: MBL fold metallo-hydrolase [Oceanotoga]MDN5341621.1 ribonuclease [Oceanotoga sp.]PWJ96553.1 RNAse Z [Oceanotoga teriensis]